MRVSTKIQHVVTSLVALRFGSKKGELAGKGDILPKDKDKLKVLHNGPTNIRWQDLFIPKYNSKFYM